MQSGLQLICSKLKVPAEVFPPEFLVMPGILSTFCPLSLPYVCGTVKKSEHDEEHKFEAAPMLM